MSGHWVGIPVALGVALASAAVTQRRVLAPRTAGRYGTIDGLRGYLALAVFLHHATLWFAAVRAGTWYAPLDFWVSAMGPLPVALFFMITAFLFTNQLLRAREAGSMDWLRYLVGRFWRLGPLYLVMLAIVLLLVGVRSGWRIAEPWGSIAADVGSWLAYCIPGYPQINGVNAGGMVSYVTWTLPYEWAFYLALPLLALALGVRAPRFVWAVTGVALVFFVITWRPAWEPSLAFLGGVVAAHGVRRPAIVRWSTTRTATVVATLAIAIAWFVPLPGWRVLMLLPATVFFVIVASGNSLGGVLTARPSRALGEVSYGVYLLHGLFLFSAFQLLLGVDSAAQLGPAAHWAIVVGLAAALIAVTSLLHRWVEVPGIAATAPTVAFLRRLSGWLGATGREVRPAPPVYDR